MPHKLVTISAILLLSLVTAWPRERRQLLDGQVDTKQVGDLLRNEAFVRTQLKCAKATVAAAAEFCDRVGHLIRKNVPTAIRTAACPGNCSVSELKAVAAAYDIVTGLYPVLWKELLEHYKITDAQNTALVKWLDGIKAMPEPDKTRK